MDNTHDRIDLPVGTARQPIPVANINILCGRFRIPGNIDGDQGFLVFNGCQDCIEAFVLKLLLKNGMRRLDRRAQNPGLLRRRNRPACIEPILPHRAPSFALSMQSVVVME